MDKEFDIESWKQRLHNTKTEEEFRQVIQELPMLEEVSTLLADLIDLHGIYPDDL